MSPSAAWLDEARKPNARPIYVYQIPAHDVYIASEAGHYPVAGKGEPYHLDVIDQNGLPKFTRKIQNIFEGRSVTSFGAIKLIDDGRWDSLFGPYDSTLRGAMVYGHVTFPGLPWDDAELYLTARVKTATSTGKGDLTLNLVDATSQNLLATRLAEGTYTSQKLGDVVKARLVAAGLNYPDDFDTTAWNAWTASGKVGDYTVTGQWSEGDVFSIIDALIGDTLTWYAIRRDGKFFIEQFTDLGAAPAVDIDMTDVDSVFDQSASVTLHQPVFRQQTIQYNGGASSVTKTVNLSTSHPWWPTAKDGQPKDCGIVGISDATPLATARLTLLSAEHAIVKVAGDSRLLGYDLGATVKMAVGDKQAPALASLYHRLVEIDEDPGKGQIVVTLWTKLGGPPLP